MSQSQVTHTSEANSNTCSASLSPSDSISQQNLKKLIKKDQQKSNVNFSQLAESFFGQTLKDGKRMCQVPLCRQSLKIHKDTKTNLVNHVQKKHPEQWEQALTLGNKPLPGLPNKLGNQSLLHTSLIQNISDKTKQQQFEESLLSFVIVNQLSFQLVESQYFQDMIHGKFPISAMNQVRFISILLKISF